jgi:micrococcal nuclease
MKKTLILLLVSFGLQAQKYQTVTRVVDGDTYILSSGLRARIINCNTPERKNALTSQTQPYADSVYVVVKNLIEGKKVKVTKYKKDFYGRTLVSIKLDKIVLYNYLVKNGLAWNTSKKGYLKKAEAKARLKKVGIWKDPNAIDPNTWRKIYSTR